MGAAPQRLPRICRGGHQGWRAREQRGAIADAAMQRWFSPAFTAAQPAQVARWRRRLVSSPLAGYLGCCHAVMNMHTADRLAQIAMPSLIIAGGLDQGTPLAMSAAMAQCIPGAQLEVLESAAHLSVLEDVVRFAALLRNFLDGLDP